MSNILKSLFSITILLSSIINAAPLQKVSIQLMWLDQFQFAGYYMAKEKGFYKEAGLDVEIKKFDFGIDPVEEVIEKRADYGVGRSSLIIEKSAGKDIVLLNAVFQSSPLILLARKDSNIKSIKDFKNKKIMITPDASSSVSLYAMVSKNGIDIDDMIKQNHSFNLDDLIYKKTDLMASYISNEPYKMERKGIEYTIFDPKDHGFDFYGDILFTGSKEIKDNKKRALKFAKASMRGWRYAFNNIEESIDLIIKKYNIQNKSKESLLFEAKELKKLAFYKTNEIGHIDKNKIQRIYDIYNVMGAIKKDLIIDDLIFHTDKYRIIDITDKELAFVETHPIIKVQNEDHWPPFNYNENGLPKGFSIDYMELVAKKAGLEVEYIQGYSWSEYMDMVLTDKLDVIINIAKNKQRAKKILFTPGYYATQNAIFVNTKKNGIYSIKDLFGKTIAMPKDFVTQKYIEKHYPKIKQIHVKDSLEALKLLSLGKVDATVGKKVVLDFLIQHNNISEVKASAFVDEKGFTSILRLGVSKKDTTLNQILTKAQASITDKELNGLKEKWFGQTFDNNRLNFTKEQQRYIKQNNIIKVCTNNDFAPVEFMESGKIQGASIDILNLIKEKTGMKIEFIPSLSYEDSQKKFKEGECDLLPSFVRTPQREEFSLFTKSYISDTLALITKNDKPYITNIEQLKNKKMSIKKGCGISNEIISKYKGIKIDELDKFKDILENVSNNKIYFTFTTVPVFSYYKSKYNFEDLQISGYSNIKCNISLAVNKEKKILFEIVNKAFNSISDETLKVIFDKWNNLKIQKEFDKKRLYKIISTVMVVLAILFFVLIYRQRILDKYNRKLKKEIESATIEIKLKNVSLKKKQIEQEQLLDTTIEAVVLFGEDRKLEYINQAGIDLFRFPSLKEAKKYHVMDFVPENEHIKVKEALKQRVTKPYELTVKRYDNTTFPALVAGRNVTIDNKNVRVSYAYDLSQLKEKDQYMFHQSRFAQMGEMISMIAHQWRQPLNAISATSNNLLYKTVLDNVEKDIFEKELSLINDYSQHLSQTIDDFRDFFKKDKERIDTTLENAVEGILSIAKVSLNNKNIKVVTKFECNKTFKLYNNELKQVLLNLIKNAEDALVDKKIPNATIVIETHGGERDKIVVKDNAGGVPEDIIDYIFDPYFSTKHDRNGTGLGLYMSKKIIEEHLGGELNVYNDESGAVFVVDI